MAAALLAGCVASRQADIPKLAPAASITATQPSERILYAFNVWPDGERPFWGVASGPGDRLYAAADEGGGAKLGAIVELAPSGARFPGVDNESVIHNDTYFDPGPSGVLVRDSRGNLYGTSHEGGYLGPCDSGVGCGVVFELTPAAHGYDETALWKFSDVPDGAYPAGGVIRDRHGVIYGQTGYGGSHGGGAVFKLTPARSGYAETIVHSFGLHGDGAIPEGPIFMDDAGAIYGGTSAGGIHNHGVVYKLTPSGTTYRESILHAFHNREDGRLPIYGVTVDSSGNVFGVDSSSGCCGNVFEITPGTHGYRFRIIWTFTGGPNGSAPSSTLLDDKGVLYGETTYGGNGRGWIFKGSGTIYSLTPSGRNYTERVLYRFAAGSDGAWPQGSLLLKAGSLYGTTVAGGSYDGGSCGYNGCGTVFALRLR